MRESFVPPPTLAGPQSPRERERLSLPLQRLALNRLARELDLNLQSISKDGSGDWTLEGANGTVHALPRGYELFVCCDNAERWTWAKATLDFVSILKQNETSGIFWLSKMPTPDEGDAIVAVLGLRRPANAVVESTGRISSWRAP